MRLNREIKTAGAALIFAFILCSGAMAVPAGPMAHEFTQPDGYKFNAVQWGDENGHGWQTSDGYSIVYDSLAGRWAYAELGPDGMLKSSGRPVGPVKGPQRFLRPKAKPETVRSILADRPSYRADSLASPLARIPKTGTNNIFVVLVNFNDTSTTYTSTDFNSLLFGSSVNSMKDYYTEVSYGVFTVSAGAGGIAGWYNAANTHNYYGGNDAGGYDKFPGTLVREAAAAADAAGFNFAPYDQDGDCYVDSASVIHQGTGEEWGLDSNDIWSHSWTLNAAFASGYGDGGEYTTNDACPSGGNIKVNAYVIQPEKADDGGLNTVGVFVHEYGHALGLPDLYDTDYSSVGAGMWCVMASGSWGGVSRYGDRPVHMSAWAKYFLGWVSPAIVAATLTGETISEAESSSDVYQLLNGNPTLGGEYFLIENRQKTKFDAGLPSSGLLIWHVDEAKSNNNGECSPPSNCASTHYKVQLVQADNLWQLEQNINSGNSGDPFPGSGGVTSVMDYSNPSIKLHSGAASGACITDISASASAMTASITPTGCSLAAAQPSAVSMANTYTNSSNTSTVVITNTGGNALTINTVTLTGDAEFTIISDSCTGATLSGGASCSIIIKFSPSSGGNRASSLSVQTSANNLTITITASAIELVEKQDSSGGGGGGGGGCFVATAAFGHPDAAEVMMLRDFRDRRLMTNRPGRALVALYYAVSPPVADFIRDKPLLKSVVRGRLVMIAYAVGYPYIALAFISALIIVLAARININHRTGENKGK